ncbi:hypothetical protein [Hansschlegelia sp. KR7-227]|jgi:hypothetical protein|uniref:hypothetical protein n=1 Tax=Hansschlegelia sp. KR7-227 TaxID=3400914 RepID=UPI003BFB525E
MRTISGFLQLLGLLVILVAGYWTWYATWGSNPNDKVGVALTPWIPGPMRDWGCGKLNQRFPQAAPTACSPVAGSVTPPTTAPEPARPDGGGSL